MSMTYAWAKTGHPNCRRPDKVIDARQTCIKEPMKNYYAKVQYGSDVFRIEAKCEFNLCGEVFF